MKQKNSLFFLLVFLLLLSGFNVPAQNNCIDLTNLNVSYVHCTYGDFWNPYLFQGCVPGRHTVITSQGTDNYSNGQLYVIPPGESYSIRLGNEDTGAQAESIAVDIAVDTNNFDLLILKYAAVMEDPNHSASEQPRFTFDILDIHDTPINPDCLSADFIANASLGWNSVNYGNILWKDWTNVGVDISEYHGQTIRVRLTTYDCSQSGHFGYAYFLLTCGSKHITIDVCGDVDQYSYSAPSGFNYRWFWDDDPSDVISTNQTISVAAGGDRRLACYVSFVENSSCGFELFTTTEYRFPISGFELSETNCAQELHFINKSFVSNDGINPDGTGNLCSDTFWDFGDGQTSTAISPIHKYQYAGNYTVMMVAGLNDFECTDTTYMDVYIPENTSIDTLVCEEYVWNGTVYSVGGIYQQSFTTNNGCDSLVVLNLTVVDQFETAFDRIGCDSVFWNDVRYDKTGVYTQNLSSMYGCDSIVTMNLDMNYTPYFTIHGNHWPIGGTELEWTQYTYHINLEHPLCVVDYVEWSVECPTMFVFPSEDGMSCDLRIFSYLPPTDSVPLRAVVHNRCGTETNTFWIHTSYHDVDEYLTGVIGLSVFPNPTQDLLNIVMNGMYGDVTLELYDAHGVLVDQWAHQNLSDDESIVYNVSSLREGLYSLKVIHPKQTLVRKILVKS